MVEKIYVMMGVWDFKCLIEGVFIVLMNFVGGCVVNMMYLGYVYFDSDIWMNNVGEFG